MYKIYLVKADLINCPSYVVSETPGLPVCPEMTREHIPKARDVGHFLSVTGTVIRTSVTKVLEYQRDYMCNKCRHVFSVQADFEQHYSFTPPSRCPSEDECGSFKFTCLAERDAPPSSCRDYQEIKIQEQVRTSGERHSGKSNHCKL